MTMEQGEEFLKLSIASPLPLSFCYYFSFTVHVFSCFSRGLSQRKWLELHTYMVKMCRRAYNDNLNTNQQNTLAPYTQLHTFTLSNALSKKPGIYLSDRENKRAIKLNLCKECIHLKRNNVLIFNCIHHILLHVFPSTSLAFCSLMASTE